MNSHQITSFSSLAQTDLLDMCVVATPCSAFVLTDSTQTPPTLAHQKDSCESDYSQFASSKLTRSSSAKLNGGASPPGQSEINSSRSGSCISFGSQSSIEIWHPSSDQNKSDQIVDKASQDTEVSNYGELAHLGRT